MESVYSQFQREDTIVGVFGSLASAPRDRERPESEEVSRCRWNGRHYAMTSELPPVPARIQGASRTNPRGDVELVARGKLSWLPVHDGDLVAINGGEFGFVVLHVDERRRVQSFGAGSAEWLVRTPQGVIAISTAEHLGWSDGELFRLAKVRRQWEAEGFARLPGAVLSYAVVEDGTILTSTTFGDVGVQPSGLVVRIDCD